MLPKITSPIPGPKSQHQLQRLKRLENPSITYVGTDFPICCTQAHGTNVWDADGNRFLDMTSFFAVASLGHSHPAITQSVQEQMEHLCHAMGDVHPAQVKIEFLEALQSVLPEGLGYPILCTSGSEAVEAAIKTILIHTKKPGIVSFGSGYHGLGLGAVSLMDWDFFQKPFQAWMHKDVHVFPYPNCYRCPFGCSNENHCNLTCMERLEAFLHQMETQHPPIGGMILEPIQGRGGIVTPPTGFLPALRELCNKKKITLCFDEIYTGCGRTGTWWACEWDAIIPDVMCIGKALANGIPLSACIMTEEIAQSWGNSTGEAIHTSTFLGNPIAMRAGISAIQELQKIIPSIQTISTRIQQDLLTLAESNRWIGDIRGKGMMWGIECIQPVDPGQKDPDQKHSNSEYASRIMSHALKKGVLLLTSGKQGNIVSLTPPFILSMEEWDYVFDCLSHTQSTS